jgi:hypothetical protein
VKGIDSQRTCDVCRKHGAPARVSWSYLTGEVPSAGIEMGSASGGSTPPSEPRAEVGSFRATTVAEARERLAELVTEEPAEPAD